MKIRIVDGLTDEERRSLFGWGEDIFNVNSLNMKWRLKEKRLLVDVDGRTAAQVGLLQHTISVGGREVKVGGIGSVVTALEFQGKGYASQAMRYARNLMCEEWAVDFGFLFCREQLVPFYERLGWQRVLEPVEVEQPEGPVQWPLAAMVLPCREQTWPAGRVQLNSLPW